MKSILSVSLAAFAVIATANAWDYTDVDGWSETSQVCGSGTRQSPIDVNTNTTVWDSELQNRFLKFDRYNDVVPGTLTNTGHSIQFAIDSSVAASDRPRIYDGGLGQDGYILEQFHIHWGSVDCVGPNCVGSEHLVNGKTSVAEVHFVHYNAKYNSFTDASGNSDGLAVVGFLLELTRENPRNKVDFVQVGKPVPAVSEAGLSVQASLRLGTLIPKFARDGSSVYFRYQGSLTTPPCTESVTWTLFGTPVLVHQTAFEALRDVTTVEEGTVMQLVNNHRPVQPSSSIVVMSNRKIHA